MSDGEFSDTNFDDYSPAVLPDGVRKEVISEADDKKAKKPRPGDEVTIDYSGVLASSGIEFESLHSRDAPFTFTLGQSEVIKGWDLGVATMKKGERAKFTMEPEFAYGEDGREPSVPPHSTVVFTIELVSWVKKEDLFQDKSVIKSLWEEGSGYEHPKKGKEVRIAINAVAESGAVLHDRSGADYVLGSDEFGSLGKAVDKALRGMLKGERCSLKCLKGSVHQEEVKIGLTLEEIYNVEDVSWAKDSSVMKKRLSEGEGHQRPQDCCRVEIVVESVTDKAGNACPGFSGPQQVRFLSGNGDVCDALESAVSHMKKGERAAITSVASKAVSPSLGFAEVTSDAVVFTVEVVDFSTMPNHQNLHEEDKVMLASRQKDVGAQLYKKQRFELALEKYKKVVEGLHDTNKWSDECKQEAKELKKAAKLNQAACFLKMGNLASTLSTCNEILRDEPYNVKALFRRAKAHHGRSEVVEALRDLEKTLEYDPENAEAKALLPHVKKAKKLADKESQDTFSKMCQGFGKLGSGKENHKPPPNEKPIEPPKEKSDEVAVTFRMRDPEVGEDEQLRVVGAAEVLGAWDQEKSVELQLLPPVFAPPTGSGRAPKVEKIWEATVDIPQGEGRAEYRYLVRGPGGDRLEPGVHAVHLAGMGGSRQRCTDYWKNA